MWKQHHDNTQFPILLEKLTERGLLSEDVT